MGVTDEVFYDHTKVALIPMDFYFPGSKERGDLPPRPEFAKRWHKPILSEMPEISLTLLIGQYAQKYYLVNSEGERYQPSRFPLVHPSPRNNIWQKKNPWFEKDLLPALRKRISSSLKL